MSRLVLNKHLTEGSSLMLGGYWGRRNLQTLKSQYPGFKTSMFYSRKRSYQWLLRHDMHMLFKRQKQTIIFMHYNKGRNIKMMTLYTDFHSFSGRIWNSFNKNFITRKNTQERRRIKAHPTNWMLTQNQKTEGVKHPLDSQTRDR